MPRLRRCRAFESCTVRRTAVIPVDIPSRWKPRTNQSPTGALIAPPAAWPCCSSPVPSTTKKSPDRKVWGLWWTVQDSNRAALTRSGRVSNQPSGLLLSPRFPAARNVYQGRTNPILYEKGFGFVFVYRRFCDESTQEKEQALTYSGVLSLAGVVYSA